jgi:hypothetical protein
MSIVRTRQSPEDAFLAAVAQIGINRGDRPSVRLYEAWKADYARQFPDASPDQYARAMRVISRAAGV